jgi:hypothetical protein
MPPLPSARRGCLQMLAVPVGALMMFPGICAILLVAVTPRGSKADGATAAAVLIAPTLGLVGVALIEWAVRRPWR